MIDDYYESPSLLASNSFHDDVMDCTKSFFISNNNCSTAIETNALELAESDDFTEKIENKHFSNDEDSMIHPSSVDIDSVLDLSSNHRKPVEIPQIFKVCKVNHKKLAIKAKTIHLKNCIIQRLMANKESQYFDYVNKKIMKEKQQYSKEHVELFLNFSIKRFILECFPPDLSSEEKQDGLKILCINITIGDKVLQEGDIFLDFYQKNHITELFCRDKEKSKWRRYRNKPLNELLEEVYSRTLTSSAIIERTVKTKKNKEMKLLGKKTELKLISGLQASKADLTHFQK